MDKEKLFKEGNIKKAIIKLSLPLVVSQLVNVLYNIVDRIYVGNIPGIGKDALAGLGVTFPIIMIISAFAALFGAGGAPIAAIQMGEGKKDKAQETMMNGLFMLLTIGIILTIILLIFGENLLFLFGAKDSIINYSKEYLNIYSLGTIFVMISLGMTSYITAQGNTNVAMFSVIIGAVLNIVLDPIFIYTFDMGVSGAALATIISQAVSSAYIIIFLCSKNSNLRINFKKTNLKTVLPIIALGVSPFIMNATESLIQIIFNIQIKKYGGDDYIIYINVITIMLSLMQVIILPLTGLSQGVSPLISYNYGAGKIDRVKEAIKYLIRISLIYSLSFYIIIFLAPNLFVRIFNNDPRLLEISPKLFRIFFAGISIMGLQIACQNTFMALKQSLISLLLALLRKVILLTPLALLLPFALGINGVFYSEAIADIIAVITTTTVFAIFLPKILDKKLNNL